MPQLIIGHTTDTTARIWVQGDKAVPARCAVEPASPSAEPPKHIRLHVGDGLYRHRRLQRPERRTRVHRPRHVFSCRERVSGTFRTIRRARAVRGCRSASCFRAAICRWSASTISWRFSWRLPGRQRPCSRSIFRLTAGSVFGFNWLRRLVRWPLQRLLMTRRRPRQEDDRHQAAGAAVSQEPVPEARGRVRVPTGGYRRCRMATTRVRFRRWATSSSHQARAGCSPVRPDATPTNGGTAGSS